MHFDFTFCEKSNFAFRSLVYDRNYQWISYVWRVKQIWYICECYIIQRMDLKSYFRKNRFIVTDFEYRNNNLSILYFKKIY